ncbi:CD276 antigen-like isoform X4 [Clupea harengus]|uniref:CD276 antigen-like isoform X4 n=1 Tax=Clupea harengus TaxID=7950 RepID=A0A6P8F3I4_CLUHA|nr:CD276 antigen-like isoform X4 [Clupea harengus]
MVHMASAIAILLVVISFITVSLSADSDFHTLECQSSTGHSGQPSKLDCVVKTKYNRTILKVYWKKDVQHVLTFDGGINPENGRFQFADTNWRTSKNISLLVKDTKVSDEGNYSCTVVTTLGPKKGYARFNVKAKYSQPEITSKDITEDRVDLTCVSSGGYPSGAIHWFDRLGTNWTRSTETTKTQEEDKSFQLQSTFLSADPSHAPYTCVVFNSEWKAEGEETILGTHLNKQTPIKADTTSIVAGAVVIGSLIVGLLVALLISRRRSQRPEQERIDYDYASPDPEDARVLNPPPP